MQIINVIEISNGIISSVESWLTDNSLSKLDSEYFFTEDKAVQKAEESFLSKIKQNIDEDIRLGDDDYYLEEAYAEDNNGYEVMIHWSDVVNNLNN